MSRQTLKTRHRKICIGDLNKIITLSEREITPPVFGSTNFGESFPAPRDVWAKVKTINGRTLFNGVDADVALTHEITIRYDPLVTAETWVQLVNGTRLNVIDVQNFEEEDEYQVLLCNARGTQEASKA